MEDLTFPGHVPHWGEHKVPDSILQDLMKNGPKVDKKLAKMFSYAVEVQPKKKVDTPWAAFEEPALIKNTDLV